MMRSLPLTGLSVLAILTIALTAAASFFPSTNRFWIQAMIIVASLEGLVGFWSLSVALRRSNQVFYGVFAGGMLVRLLLIGGATAVLVHWAPSVTLPLLALVTTFFIFSMVQLPFLVRKPVWIS